MTFMADYITLFLSGFLSATLLPGTSEIVLIAMLSQGVGESLFLVIAATIGNVMGSLVNWLLGKYLIRFMDSRWFPVSRKQYERAKLWFEHYGIWSLLLAWLPIVGDPLTLIAGTLGVRLKVFLILVTIGKFARYAFIAWVSGIIVG